MSRMRAGGGGHIFEADFLLLWESGAIGSVCLDLRCADRVRLVAKLRVAEGQREIVLSDGHTQVTHSQCFILVLFGLTIQPCFFHLLQSIAPFLVPDWNRSAPRDRHMEVPYR